MKKLVKLSLAPIYAVALTVISYITAKVIPATYIAKIMTDRGPISYVVVYLMFLSLCMSIIVRYQKRYEPTLLLGLFGISVMPLLFGLVGTISEFSFSLLSLRSEYGIKLMQNDEIKTAIEVIDQYYQSVANSADTTFLGLCATLLCWLVVTGLCIDKCRANNIVARE